MATSTAGSNKISILDKLIAILNEISDFTGNVYGGYRPESAVKADKHILVHLVEDRYVGGSLDEDEHSIQFNVLVKYRAGTKGDPKEQMDIFIDTVGLVEDKLKANYNVPGVWEDLRINRINYTFGQSRGFNYYSGMITLTIRTQW